MKNSDPGLGTRLRRLLELLDGNLDELYAETAPGYRARFTPIMKALDGEQRLTIKEIAATSDVSHSAASQTVSLMVANDILEWETGSDARERLIRLSKKGRGLLPILRAQWERTANAALELEREIDLPLSLAVTKAIRALEEKSFRSRVR